jgi:hypothetical protein
VPPQAGHFVRIKATPSDLPFKFTGFAIYPVPPQFGQSSGSTPLPLSVRGIFYETEARSLKDCFVLRKTNKVMASLETTARKGRANLSGRSSLVDASYLLVLQLLATFFTLVTLNV